MDRKGSPQKRQDKPTSCRTRTGCLTCRQRRKKCDEARPVCVGCARNFLDCQWPSPAATKRSSRSRSGRPKENHSSTNPGNGKTSPAGATTLTFVFDKYSLSSESESPDPVSIEVEDEGEADTPESIVLWQSPRASFIGAERALSLTPSSFLLLQHYLEQTSPVLVPKPLSSNPFLTLVLPLAYSDDLLMHAVLALSGTHLSFRRGHGLEIQLATRRHYSSLLRNLRPLFADGLVHEDVKKTLRLILILVVLCHVEALAGEPHGGIFPHLKACRELVAQLLQHPHASMQGDTKRIKGFALEVYSYLVLANSITPYGRDESRTIPFDSFCTSLEFLREYETFGVFVGCGQGLFEIIPQISIFAMNRLAEEDAGSCDLSADSQSTYKALETALTEWQSPPVGAEMAQWEAQHVCAGEMYRQALLIFLRASMCGSVVSNPKVMVKIQKHIDVVFPLLLPLTESPFMTIMLWPTMIIGSCLICEHQRRETLNRLTHETKIDIYQVFQAARLLELLWQDDDPCAYGPFGLDFVMRKNHINFSMA